MIPARLSFVTPGVEDLDRAKRFYQVQAQWLPSRLVPHRHRPRAELQPAHERQVDMLR